MQDTPVSSPLPHTTPTRTGRVSTAVVGAGPYGLSVAAHLRARGVETAVLGRPMSFWQGMPPQMMLKSPWTASNLSDPASRYSLDRYVDETGRREEPLPIAYFLQYAGWFRRAAVGEVDERLVRRISPVDGGFRLDLEDGASLEADRVVVAVGIARFPHVPDFAAALPGELVTHGQHFDDPTRFAGKKVAVIGRGQSALEWAVLTREAGADTELLARGPVRFVDRRFAHTPVLRHAFYPPDDVGPPGLNQLVSRPRLFGMLPAETRVRWGMRAVRPAGADWLEPRFGGMPTTEGVDVAGAEEKGGRVALRLSDGTAREVDHVILGTGYRPHLGRLDLCSDELIERVAMADGYPVLDPTFQTSVPGLHVVGALAAYSFGPVFRFVAGAGRAARGVARGAR